MMKRLLLLTLMPLALSSCTNTLLEAGAYAKEKFIFNQESDFSSQHYAVADYLYQQAESFIKHGNLIKAEPLTDLDTPEISTILASAIPEQVGVRLSQLGFSMDLRDVSTSVDTQYLRPKFEGQNADFVLTGNYIVKGRNLDVKIRMIDLDQNRVIATFDYRVEIRGDLKRLSAPKARISRIAQ